MANFSRTDLDFLLDQIFISESDSVAQQGGTFDSLPSLVGSPLLPHGLRNVDGTYNNLQPDQSLFGAADQVFPRLLDPVFRTGENIPVGFPGAGTPTSYAQTKGFVFDSQPRMISNLIVDQTAGNPAAAEAANQTGGSELVSGTRVDGSTFETYFIPNTTPDVGLSAPYNSWFTLFGQFFDHGLDLVNKGQSGTVFVPLQDDDPLVTGPDGVLGDDLLTPEDESADDLPANLRFMTLTRATNLPGPDGITGDDPLTLGDDESADDIHDHINQTTPFIDQNQTYTSHPSHQVFLREYVSNVTTGDTEATGKLLEGSATGDGLATWADIKAQALSMLGLKLTDADVTNLPLLATDTYGKFIPGPNGFAQLVLADDTLLEGDPTANGNTGVEIPVNVVRTGHAFLDDIAHTAVPKFSSPGVLSPDADTDTGNTPASGTYDNELLDRHFATGDGRGNENIGLTTVHTVFHAEHNRKVDEVKALVIASGDPVFIAQWQLPDGSWNGDRLFQAARFATEMQYQHLVFEEFARKVQPNVDVFIGYNSTIDPAIMAEFAHVVYRFGHSMLTETVARTNSDGQLNDIGLIQAFLNPVEFGAGYANSTEAAGAVVKGMTKQVGNEIDEFVTEALRNNLVGLPLDLPTINMTRARDTGVPSLNEARRMFYEDTGQNATLQPYESWADFGLGIRHPESLTNFIAAYGTHTSITGATTLADKRAAAQAIMDAANDDLDPNHDDAVAFLNSTGDYASLPSGVTTTGLDAVDFWIGGLAEKQAPFGGLLGNTFNFVFETQMENLQDGDRFYYLARTAGLDFLTQLEENSFAEMVMRNLPDVKHLPFDIFSTPAYTFEVGNLGTTGPIEDDPNTLNVNEATLKNHLNRPALVRDTTLGTNTIRYTGDQHVVMGGTDGVNRIRASEGDDTIWGDGGNDRLEGGAGNDSLNGGDGNDIITDSFGDDNIKGGDGHDVINGGPGINLILAGAGNDFVVTGNDISEVFAGPGNDFIFGNTPNEVMQGNEGDDWIQTGTADGAPGDNFDPFGRDPIRGNDVFLGNGGLDEFIGEGGDDLMNGFAGADRNDGNSGFDWVFSKGSNIVADIDLTRNLLAGPFVEVVDRYDFVEAASGWNLNDVIRGDDATSVELELVDAITGQNNALDDVNNPASGGHTAADRIALIDGLDDLLGGATTFSAGNILLGGAGNDLIEGRGGNDIIDGDAWLNVRISVRNVADTAEIASFDNMTSALRTAMQNGTYSPDQLRIVRKIETAPAGTNIDTAVFQDVFASYVLTIGTDGTIFVDHANPTVAAINDGNDTIRHVERLQFTDRIAIIGTVGDDNLVGTANNDTLIALAGNDRLDGLGGIDALIGGLGNDTFVVDTTTDTITEAAGVGSGIDIVESSVTFTIAAAPNLENITLTGLNAINATGNAANNILIGNDNNNVLTGGAGNDTLTGNGGNDTLAGGAGNDTMVGGLGDDTYSVGGAADVVTELAGEGTDTVASTITYSLAARPDLENLQLEGAAAINGTGNGANNILTGNGANNTLSGGGGDDDLIGGVGADSLTGGAGVDDFIYSAIGQSTVAAAGRDSITVFVPGTDRIDLSAIDAIVGNVGNDSFTFIGAAAFFDVGQVRYAGGALQANIGGANGNAADFQIQLVGGPLFTAVDLVA